MYGRLLSAACFFACLLAYFFPSQVSAQGLDTSTCGALACEQAIANGVSPVSGYPCQPGSSVPAYGTSGSLCRCSSKSQGVWNGSFNVSSTTHVASQCPSIGTDYFGVSFLQYTSSLTRTTVENGYTWPSSQAGCSPVFSPCNCTLAADTFEDYAMPVNSSKHFCRSGCRFKPKPGSAMVCMHEDPANPTSQYVCTSTAGWTNDGGANCDPINPPPGEQVYQSSAPPPACTQTNNGRDCILTDPTVPSKACGTKSGSSVGCLTFSPTPTDCSTTPSGSMCPGNAVPVPPDGKFNPTPDLPPLSLDSISSGGDPTFIIINFYGPPVDTQQCPAGTQGVYPNCSSFVPCPDGSAPVAGMCPAPVSNFCPDGTLPVNGLCNSPPNGTCPNGTPAVGGLCAAPSGSCPNGAPPVNGYCPVGGGGGGNSGSGSNTSSCPTGGANCNGSASGGQTCLSPPSCAGDPVGCAQLTQIWLSRCQNTLLPGSVVDGSGGFSTGDPGGGPISGKTLADGGFSGDVVKDLGDPTTSLDTSGWLGFGGSCPAFPSASVTFMDKTIDIGSVLNGLNYCFVFTLIHGFVLALAALKCARIISAS